MKKKVGLRIDFAFSDGRYMASLEEPDVDVAARIVATFVLERGGKGGSVRFRAIDPVPDSTQTRRTARSRAAR